MLSDSFLDISLSKQRLTVIEYGQAQSSYLISTAKKGAGELMGSECTPTGWHKIRAKIGDGLPLHSVLIARRATGEVYSSELNQRYPERDWILTRILWLGGLEPHKNRYGQVDTTWRYIYIHGSPDELIDGKPHSHGCIRMKNNDILDLFNRVTVGMKVYSHE